MGKLSQYKPGKQPSSADITTGTYRARGKRPVIQTSLKQEWVIELLMGDWKKERNKRKKELLLY